MSTETFFCNMGVTTMKMISSTSITSTMGVTLISEVTLAASFRFANAIEFCLLRWACPPPNRNDNYEEDLAPAGYRRLFSNFFLQAEDGIRDSEVTGVQTCALPI